MANLLHQNFAGNTINAFNAGQQNRYAREDRAAQQNALVQQGEEQEEQKRIKNAAVGYQRISAAPEPLREAEFQSWKRANQEAGMDVSRYPANYTPEVLSFLGNRGQVTPSQSNNKLTNFQRTEDGGMIGYSGETGRYEPVDLQGARLAEKQPLVKVGPGQTKEQEAVGAYRGNRYVEFQQKADESYVSDGKMTALINAAQNPDVYTGAGANQVLALKKLGRAAGFDVEGIGDSELIVSIGNLMATGLKKELPGPMSDGDRQFLLDSVPTLATSMEGIQKMAKYQKKINERRRVAARMAREYRAKHGVLDHGFSQMLDQWTEANPMFVDWASKGYRRMRDANGNQAWVHPESNDIQEVL